jgi:hypothetical protein
MADLGANSLWSDLENVGNNVEGAADKVSSNILGPEYSYSDNIPGPNSLGVGSNGSMSQLMTNINAANQYVKIMITGDPPLGNQYYVNTGGACTAPDGSTQARYNYINNKSVGADLLPQGLNDLSFLSSDLNGLIPGIVGDLEGLDPLYLFNSLVADGTPQCQCYQCAVTDGSPYNFLTPSLSPDFDTNLCTQVDVSLCKKAGTESFTNWRTARMSCVPTIAAFMGLLLLTFSGK